MAGAARDRLPFTGERRRRRAPLFLADAVGCRLPKEGAWRSSAKSLSTLPSERRDAAKRARGAQPLAKASGGVRPIVCPDPRRAKKRRSGFNAIRNRPI